MSTTPEHDTFNETADPAAGWRGVFLDGPEPDEDATGEEIPVWTVFIGNDEADPTSTVYRLHNHKSAQALAKRMAHDRRLELIDDASPA